MAIASINKFALMLESEEPVPGVSADINVVGEIASQNITGVLKVVCSITLYIRIKLVRIIK